MQSRKIIHIIDTLGLGGAQTIIKSVVEAWDDPRIEFWIFGLRNTEIVVKINHPRVFVNPNSGKYSLSGICRVGRLINEHNIDTIHCHLPKSIWIGLLIKFFFAPKIRLIYHEHGDILINSSSLDSYIHKIGVKFILNFFNKIIGVSNTIVSEIKKTNPKLISKTIPIHNFVDLERFSPMSYKERGELRNRFNIDNNTFIIGFIGRLAPPKRIEVIVDALSKLEIDFKAIFIGEGNLRQSIEEQISNLKLDKKVELWGYRDDVEHSIWQRTFNPLIVSYLY